MSWFTKFIKKIAGFFKDPKTKAAFEQTLQTLQPYIAAAEPVVETIVALTPNRTDDELLALAKQFGVVDLFKSNMTDGEVKNFLLDAGTAALQKAVPDPVESSTLRAAIDVAYSTYKAKQAAK